MENNLVTTVATPAKCPGRWIPSSDCAAGPGSIGGASLPCVGYISSTDGINTISAPCSSKLSISTASSRG